LADIQERAEKERKLDERWGDQGTMRERCGPPVRYSVYRNRSTRGVRVVKVVKEMMIEKNLSNRADGFV
jgi:hypothetical protein